MKNISLSESRPPRWLRPAFLRLGWLWLVLVAGLAHPARAEEGKIWVPPQDVEVPARTVTHPAQTVIVPEVRRWVPESTVTVPASTRWVPEQTIWVGEQVVSVPEQVVWIDGYTVWVDEQWSWNEETQDWDYTPGYEQTVPGHEETIPGYDYTIPGHEETIPGYEETVPEHEETVPGYEEVIPEHEETIPEWTETIPAHIETIPGYWRDPEWASFDEVGDWQPAGEWLPSATEYPIGHLFLQSRAIAKERRQGERSELGEERDVVVTVAEAAIESQEAYGTMEVWTEFTTISDAPLSEWSPDPSTVPLGQHFNQSRMVIRTHRMGQRNQLGEERNVVTETGEMEVVQASVGTGTDVWVAFSEEVSRTPVGDWSPAASTQTAGLPFTQTRTVNIVTRTGQRNTIGTVRNEVLVPSQGTESRTETGTGTAPPNGGSGGGGGTGPDLGATFGPGLAGPNTVRWKDVNGDGVLDEIYLAGSYRFISYVKRWYIDEAAVAYAQNLFAQTFPPLTVPQDIWFYAPLFSDGVNNESVQGWTLSWPFVTSYFSFQEWEFPILVDIRMIVQKEAGRDYGVYSIDQYGVWRLIQVVSEALYPGGGSKTLNLMGLGQNDVEGVSYVLVRLGQASDPESPVSPTGSFHSVFSTPAPFTTLFNSYTPSEPMITGNTTDSAIAAIIARLEQLIGRPLTAGEKKALREKGCVEVARILMKQPSQRNATILVLPSSHYPERAPATHWDIKAYSHYAKAVAAPTPAGTHEVIFAVGGHWKNGVAPVPAADGQVPIDSIVPNNYIVRMPFPNEDKWFNVSHGLLDPNNSTFPQSAVVYGGPPPDANFPNPPMIFVKVCVKDSP